LPLFALVFIGAFVGAFAGLGFVFAGAGLLTVVDTGVNAGGDGTGAPTAGGAGAGLAGADNMPPISIEGRESKSSNLS
jgi:hypothetical protein